MLKSNFKNQVVSLDIKSLKDSDSSNSSSVIDINNNNYYNKSDDFALAWVNLSFTQKTLFNKSKPLILCQLYGNVNLGTITALMGPSGAGKTTLLHCISGLNRDGLSDKTRIYVSKHRSILPCIIAQDVKEHLLMQLTAKESLLYASRLKNRKYTFKNFSHIDNINGLLSDLMLVDCANNMVSKCSGGEQKRLVIAMEMTSTIKPNLICIDEPTSGLDSNAAEKTINCLQKLSRLHKLAIVTSIHQPNSEVLMMFDQLYVLAKGGRCVFAGAPNALRTHLTECKIDCVDWQVPIEVLLKVSSNKSKKVLDELGIECYNLGPPDEVIRLMTKTYENVIVIEHECKMNGKLVTNSFLNNPHYFHPYDMWYIFCRSVLYNWLRQWKAHLFQATFLLGMAFWLTILFKDDIGKDGSCSTGEINLTVILDYYDAQIEARESLADKNLKFLFFFINFALFIQLNATVLTFSTEVKIFLNEHRNRWYSTSSYYWAKTIIELPIMIAIAFVYCWICYYGTSQPDMTEWYHAVYEVPERFVLFVATLTSGLINTQGLSIFVGIIFAHSFLLSIIGAIGLFLTSLLFCGFFFPISEFHKTYQFLTNFSYNKLTYQTILIILYGRDRCENESKVLTRFNLEDDDIWENLYWIIIHIVILRLGALIALLLIANPDLFTKIQNFFLRKNKQSPHSIM